MIERFNDEIKVEHKKEDSKEKRNRNRKEAIENNIDENLEIDKPTFQRFIKKSYIGNKKDEMLEKTENIDFSKANPRNNSFMNELAFAGESITEGFLECFNIERNKAIENYKNKLHVIENKEGNDQSKYYIGAFKNEKLNRLTPFQKTKDKLIRTVEEKNKKILQQEQAHKNQKIENQRTKEQTQTLQRERKEDYK
jgi:hypothetical protein